MLRFYLNWYVAWVQHKEVHAKEWKTLRFWRIHQRVFTRMEPLYLATPPTLLIHVQRRICNLDYQQLGIVCLLYLAKSPKGELLVLPVQETWSLAHKSWSAFSVPPVKSLKTMSIIRAGEHRSISFSHLGGGIHCHKRHEGKSVLQLHSHCILLNPSNLNNGRLQPVWDITVTPLRRTSYSMPDQ